MKFCWIGRAGAMALAMAMVACGSSPPAPNWAVASKSASERAVKAYLRGEQRVAQVEWDKAFAEVALTGQPAAMARMALLQCAAQTAALEITPCPRYERYAQGAAAAEQAYARYLAAAPLEQDIALLPPVQQAVARQIRQGATVGWPESGDALSQLTAAGVALRAGLLEPAAVLEAADAAAQQGWRRAVMAWLLVARKAAGDAGDLDTRNAVQLRLDVLQESNTIKK